MSYVYDPQRIDAAHLNRKIRDRRVVIVAIILVIVMIAILIGGYYLARNLNIARDRNNGTCNKNSQCPSGTPVCDGKTGTCVQCLVTADCGDCQVCTSTNLCRGVC